MAKTRQEETSRAMRGTLTLKIMLVALCKALVSLDDFKGRSKYSWAVSNLTWLIADMGHFLHVTH